MNLGRLNNGAHNTFMSNILNRMAENPAMEARIAPLAGALRDALEYERACMRKFRKSLITDQLSQADFERGRLYMGYKRAVRAYVGYPDSRKAGAAKQLMQHIKEFRINPRMQRESETGLMMRFVKDLEGKMKDNVDTLALGDFASRMREANERVVDLYRQRTLEALKKNEVGSTKAARLRTDAAYRKLVHMVNALALLDDSGLYDNFIEYANIQINDFKLKAFGRKRTQEEEDS